jgi:hypothetical protein
MSDNTRLLTIGATIIANHMDDGPCEEEEGYEECLNGYFLTSSAAVLDE